MTKCYTKLKKTFHDFKIDVIRDEDGTLEYVKAVKGILFKKEVGILGFVESDNGYCRIDYFRVREAERGKGIGRKMLERGVEEMRKRGYTEIIVYPSSEPYEEETYVEVPELYEIYKHLGFYFSREDVDTTRLNQEMKLDIINT